jgi:hypothetical protein
MAVPASGLKVSYSVPIAIWISPVFEDIAAGLRNTPYVHLHSKSVET